MVVVCAKPGINQFLLEFAGPSPVGESQVWSKRWDQSSTVGGAGPSPAGIPGLVSKREGTRNYLIGKVQIIGRPFFLVGLLASF